MNCNVMERFYWYFMEKDYVYLLLVKVVYFGFYWKYLLLLEFVLIIERVF